MSILRFSRSHEWARIENDWAVIGISNYAQEKLGDVVFVELPEIGSKFKQFSQFGTVESTKAASELYIPLSGEVSEVNKDLVSHPQWINEDAYGRGWMIKIRIENGEEVANLLEEQAYKKFVEEESK